MNAAVDLNRQIGFCNRKIDNKPADLMLAPHWESMRAETAQGAPCAYFRSVCALPEAAGDTCVRPGVHDD